MHHVFDLFSDIFAFRDNLLSRLDARVKLLLAVLTIFSVILSGKVAFPLLVLVTAVSLMLAIRLPVRLVLVRLAVPMGMVVVLVILQTFLIGSTPLFTISLLGHHIQVQEEGLWRGLLMASRVLGSVSVVLLLSFVTPAHRIFHSLRWLGVPRGWVEIATLMYRYTFTLLDQTADVLAAQRVRLGYFGLKRSLASLGVLAGAVIVQSLEQATRTYEAMTLRGYQGTMPFAPLPALTHKDLWTLALIGAGVMGIHVVLEWGVV